MESPQETVRRIDLAIIRIQKGWTQGAPARAISARSCLPDEKAAVCWCLTGALSIPALEALGPFGDLLDFIHRQLNVPYTAGDHAVAAESPAADALIKLTKIQWWNDCSDRERGEVLEVLHAARTHFAIKMQEVQPNAN
jgi:hypothetical protein